MIRNVFPYFTTNNYFRDTGITVCIYVLYNFIHQLNCCIDQMYQVVLDEKQCGYFSKDSGTQGAGNV